MDWNDIERIREPGFPVVRRGYDPRTVDNFLGNLADWLETDAATEVGQLAVRRKLELVGKATTHILLTTEQESEQLRRHAEEDCRDLRAEAETAAAATRRAADEYAQRVREKAEQDARTTQQEATAQAQATIAEGERRRAQIEELVGELNARRESALAELDHLRDELGATVGRHMPGEDSNDAPRTPAPRADAGDEAADGAKPPPERKPRQGRAAASSASR
jgi:cell division septum initiation protein DivIVA